MATQNPDPKIGAGHAAAMFRQGIAELRGALYTESNVAQPTEYGMYGKLTPQEIVGDIRASAFGDAPSPLIEQRLGEAERAPEPEPPEPERE